MENYNDQPEIEECTMEDDSMVESSTENAPPPPPPEDDDEKPNDTQNEEKSPAKVNFILIPYLVGRY